MMRAFGQCQCVCLSKLHILHARICIRLAAGSHDWAFASPLRAARPKPELLGALRPDETKIYSTGSAYLQTVFRWLVMNGHRSGQARSTKVGTQYDGIRCVRRQRAAMVPLHAVGLHSSSKQKRYKVMKVLVQYVQMNLSNTDLISDDLSSLFHASDAEVSVRMTFSGSNPMP